MEWEELKQEIIDSMLSEGYSLQPNCSIDDKNSSIAFVDMGFSVKLIGLNDRNITNRNLIGSYIVELKVSYLNNEGDRNEAEKKFIELKNSMNDSEKFPNFNSSRNNSLVDSKNDPSTVIGTLIISYGIRSC